ncbi:MULTISPECIES: ABC transporter substrate-binding protein [Desulfitobacterium]|uniref:ABC-type Fe3+-hydroxamate transport system, periplasmic component n=1 Tax=Desulfitobacterium dehalogenans (strain ATCC 51507 / DSM 9161 / JW/IU-DC1) TaxID=756499 RepID=I4AD69_DESDJ|nr:MULTISPECIES: ABC transporter substrate-binding protein [Desulfitobacterium]AFM01904.1 ABC-type Fe3+-hydroxamate transport system, periplasmic component [Desulfitobacterium dehalogenans ATCC 51507]
MRKKLISMLLAISLLLTFTTACGTNANTPNNNPSVPATSNPAELPKGELISFTDSAGRTVEIPANITRVAASGTLAQIVLFPLAADQFVGLAGKWDPSAKQYLDPKYFNLPVLGQFYGKGDLNLEEIAKADPQIIIDIGESKSSIVEDMDNIMNQVGIPTVHIEATTETMPEAYRTLGKLLNKEAEAEILAQYCEEVFKETQDIMAKVGEEEKADLVYCVGENGLNVLAKGSFHAEILDQVSNNVAVVDDISSKGDGNPVDMEQIILWDPDVIVFAPNSIYSKVSEDKTWQELKAIKNGKYYQVPLGPYNWMGNPPSVNRYIGMIWITQLLYPEQAQYDLYKETARYYKLFYHCDLTEEQYKALVTNSVI